MKIWVFRPEIKKTNFEAFSKYKHHSCQGKTFDSVFLVGFIYEIITQRLSFIHIYVMSPYFIHIYVMFPYVIHIHVMSPLVIHISVIKCVFTIFLHLHFIALNMKPNGIT